MQKGDKCLALTIWEGEPLWVAGRLHEVLEMKTSKQMVIAVRQDYQAKIGGNGVIVVPPYFCFDSISKGGAAIDAMGMALDKFVRAHVPDEDRPPLVIDEDSNAFGSPLITTASPGLVSGAGQG